jgi:uncharacterized protein
MLLWALIPCREGIGETPDQVINPKEARGEWVSDMAGVIDDEMERRLNVLIDQFEQRTTAEIAVVTIQRADEYTPKEFATELFNRWGVGKKGEDNGVLVLLVVEARRIEVETGYGVEGVLPDGKVGEILDRYAVSRFKQGDFGGGLFAGVKAMTEVIAGEETAPPQTAPQKPPFSERSPAPPVYVDAATRVFQPVIWVFGLGGVALAMMGYIGWRRSRIRYCPCCRRRMRRLDEKQDDAYLSASQKLEETLGSVDYHVWRCDECQTRRIERAVRWFTPYETCPQCGHRTVYLQSYTLREPTYERDGEEEIAKTCRFAGCAYRHRERRRIPRRPRPASFSSDSSSASSVAFPRRSSWGGGIFPSGGGRISIPRSGGSFGGGGSGGGGAGRSW